MSNRASNWAWQIEGVTATERLLLVSLADFAGPHGGDQHFCYPSQETLARRSCVSSRQVRTLLVRLEERGLIRREHRSTREGRTADRYWLPVWEAHSGVPDGTQPEETSGSPTGTLTSTNRNSDVDQPEVRFLGTVREPLLEPKNTHTPHVGRPTLLPVPETSGSENRTTKEDPLAAFDEFWTVYPKKVGKGAARRAWKGAVKKAGDPRPIIDAVTVQAPALGAAKERGFCKDPATWLNGEHWTDEKPKAVWR